MVIGRVEEFVLVVVYAARFDRIIPEQTGGGWRRVSELVPAENKQQITLRLDADLIAFFRSTGRRYQSRINAALREYVIAQKKAV